MEVQFSTLVSFIHRFTADFSVNSPNYDEYYQQQQQQLRSIIQETFDSLSVRSAKICKFPIDVAAAAEGGATVEKTRRIICPVGRKRRRMRMRRESRVASRPEHPRHGPLNPLVADSVSLLVFPSFSASRKLFLNGFIRLPCARRCCCFYCCWTGRQARAW